MSSPARLPAHRPVRFVAASCSAAVLFAACTAKKAEVSSEVRGDSAYGDESVPHAVMKEIVKEKSADKPETRVMRSSRDKADATGTGYAGGLAKQESEKGGKDALMDRLYPRQTPAQPVAEAPVDQPMGLLGNVPSPAVTAVTPVSPEANGSHHTYAAPKKAASAGDRVASQRAPGAVYNRLEGKAAADYREEDRSLGRAECYRCEPPAPPASPVYAPNTEEYAPIYENAFLEARANPLSTFSIDVDGASYSNTRRFIQEGGLPPADAVRLEEFINYFDYDYAQPTGSDPFSITTEVAATPWNPETKLVHIGLQGRRMDSEKLPPNNLVFLIDVSGSMNSPDKLPLLKNSFNMLIDQMRPQDRVSIVVYAGAAGMVLPPTSGSDKESIRGAMDRLEAGGSTAGGAGLMLAYQAAKQSFIKGGSNRVIIATDGDFNVGISSDDELVRLIEEKRKSGVFLSVLGFGTGNYKDAKMEQLADKGNGNYFYIDNINEGRKVLVEKMTGTLYAIAKDVKLQIEFNPALVKSYRLVGYENRVMAAEDFNDDRKDAGELGAGTSVTALYEITTTGAPRPKVDPLKYQNNGSSRWNWMPGRGEPSATGELLTVKFRYKQPAGSSSKLLSRTLRNRDAAWQDASENFRFSAAAAGFGLLLRGSQYSGNMDMDKVASMARGARGRDVAGHRAEFIGLVESAKAMYSPRQVGYRQDYRE
jgi:Ca-activated chloride channel family protein